MEHRFKSAGIEYYHYALHRGFNPLADLNTYFSLRQMFHEQRPVIVHAFDTKPCVWGRLAARSADVPVVIGTLPGLGTLYTGNSLKNRLVRDWIYQPLQKRASLTSEMTIFQNPEDAQQFIASGLVPESKAEILPGSGVASNIYDPSRFSEQDRHALRQELNIHKDSILVTMVSRLIRSKGVFEFMEAAQLVKKEINAVEFLLVGPQDDSSTEGLTREQISLVRDELIWIGARNDIPLILACSDIFVLPTTYREGIPRVLLEAASMGLPLVTTNIPGCNQIVEDDVNGYLVPPKDPKSLAHAITRLVVDQAVRHLFAERSRQRVLERFDLDLIAEKTRLIYKKLLSAHNLPTE